MRSFLVLVLVVTVYIGGSSHVALAEEPHGHAHHGHDLSGPELGLSAGYVHLKEEDKGVPGVHAHLLQRLGNEGILRHLAVGIGTEYLFAEDKHCALMFSIAAYPWRGLVLSVSPGVQWAEHEGKTESEYSTHLEAAYVFPLGDVDIGPAIDYSCTKDEEHYMVGLHLGIHL